MNFHLSDNIRLLRKQHHLTQEQLATALGVTVGAVYKWESKQSIPDLQILIEIATMFDQSLDALIGYGWQYGNMGHAAAKIKDLIKSNRFTEAAAIGEEMLKKYPNSFEITYQSARANWFADFTTVSSTDPNTDDDRSNNRYILRAIELFQDSFRLIDQNPDPEVNIVTLESFLAICYSRNHEDKKALELLIKNNTFGQFSSTIGSIYAQQNDADSNKEAFYHLTESLSLAISNLVNSVFGLGYLFLNGHCSPDKPSQDPVQDVIDLLQWLKTLLVGMSSKDPEVSYLHRIFVRTDTMLAAAYQKQGKDPRPFLREAFKMAQEYDLAPSRELNKIKFIDTSESIAVDDMGKTAVDIIEELIRTETYATDLVPFWEEISSGKEQYE